MGNRLTSRVREQGASLVATIPAEVARRVGVAAGQELEWIEDGMGGFRVVRHTLELTRAMEAHEAIVAEYDSVFRELAR